MAYSNPNAPVMEEMFEDATTIAKLVDFLGCIKQVVLLYHLLLALVMQCDVEYWEFFGGTDFEGVDRVHYDDDSGNNMCANTLILAWSGNRLGISAEGIQSGMERLDFCFENGKWQINQYYDQCEPSQEGTKKVLENILDLIKPHVEPGYEVRFDALGAGKSWTFTIRKADDE